MSAEEWYRANIGKPGEYAETYEHFLKAYNAGFDAGMVHQRELDASAKETKQKTLPVHLPQ